MTVEKLKNIIMKSFSVVLFSYKGLDCGIDPMGIKEYDVWCGETIETVDSIDKIMDIPIFEGKALKEIISDIHEWDC